MDTKEYIKLSSKTFCTNNCPHISEIKKIFSDFLAGPHSFSKYVQLGERSIIFGNKWKIENVNGDIEISVFDEGKNKFKPFLNKKNLSIIK